MQKKLTLLLSLCVVSLSFVTCSKLDTFTNTGSEIVEEFDPSLVRFEDNFLPVDFDSSLVAGVGSVPGAPAHGFGSHYNRLAAGKFINHWAYGAMSFSLSQSLAKRFGTTRTIDSVTFVIDTIGTVPLIAPVTPSVSALSMHLSTDSSRFYEKFPDTAKIPLSVLTAVESDATVRFIGKADSAFTSFVADRIHTYLECIDGDDDSCAYRLEEPFYLSMFNHDTTMMWFKNTPKMVVHSHDTANKAFTDSLQKSTVMFFAQESDSLVNALAPVPVSTFLARRTAEFKIDCTPLWDSLESTGFSEILTAAFVLELDTFTTEVASKDSQSIVYALFTSDRMTDGKSLDEKLNTELHYYTDSSSTNDTMIMQITTTLQKHREAKTPYLYLYLQIGSPFINVHQEFFFKKPQLKTVLTTLR